MLFKHGHLEKKLREHGKQARAEILSIKTEGQGNSMRAMFADDSDLTTGWFLCRLDLRVMPSGEPPFKTRVHTRLHTLKSKGDMVPVLCDPEDHDKVVVDYKADVEAAMHHTGEAQRLAHDLAAMEDARSSLSRRGSARSPAGAPLDPELQELMDMEEAGRQADTSHRSPAPAASGPDSRLDRLQQLGELHAQGVLTDAEFAQEKARILGET
jgi:predicted Zn-dependent peptidase